MIFIRHNSMMMGILLFFAMRALRAIVRSSHRFMNMDQVMESTIQSDRQLGITIAVFILRAFTIRNDTP